MPNVAFPNINDADDDGLLAIGGDLSTERLLLAYRSGIFPWYSDGQPILWWSPNPRMVLYPNGLKVSKSMRQLLRKDIFRVTFNTEFEKVIHHCAKANRNDQDGTWITNEMQEAYIELHKKGIAKSVEVWQDETLVGGLYGIDLGSLGQHKVFCGESMFSLVSNASKFGFIKWVQYLESQKYDVIDCQVHTAHLESLGAEMISRNEFISLLS